MRPPLKLIAAASAAALVLFAAVGMASGNRLSVSNQNIRATWSNFEFNVAGSPAGPCTLTLEGSFHARTIAKVVRSLIGAITRAAFNPGCIVHTFNGAEQYNGTTTPNTLPWHLTYASFAGTLPNISSIRVLLSRYRFGASYLGNCAVQIGNETDSIPFDANLSGGREIASFTTVFGSNSLETIIRTDRDFLGACARPGWPSPIEFYGAGTLTLLGTTSRVRVTLI